jgi:hypothetical protein
VTTPVVKPTITETIGTNGFSTSDARMSWTVTDTDRVTWTSPATVTADTADKTTQSVTIKRDTTAPALTVSALSSPRAGRPTGRPSITRRRDHVCAAVVGVIEPVGIRRHDDHAHFLLVGYGAQQVLDRL